MSQVFSEANGYSFGSSEHKNLPNGWHIQKNPKPVPNRKHDYDFWHDDYDGTDGGNGLAGTASNEDDALRQIEEIETTLHEKG